MNLLLAVTIFAVGVSTAMVVLGAVSVWRESPKPKKHHIGLYGSHELSGWFQQREKETDPYWRTMPLRTYIDQKQRQAREDIH